MEIDRYLEPAAVVAVVVVMALIPFAVSSPYYLHILILVLIYCIATVSLRSILISGQFPLAHAAFMGIGAYAAGLASTRLGWSPWITVPLGAIVAAILGVAIGYPFARLRALYYAMISLFFGIAVLQIIYALGRWTGSYGGFGNVERIFSGPGAKTSYYYLFLGLTIVSLGILYRFEKCRIGKSLKALAQSHEVASSVGINEVSHRVLALGVGCFFAGLAGAAYAHYNAVVSPNSFNLMATLWLVMYTLIGGRKSFYGPIVGTFVLVLIPELARGLQQYTPYITAVLLVMVVFLLPNGLVDLPRVIANKIRSKTMRSSAQ